MTIRDFYFEASRGALAPFSTEHKFGANDAVGTSNETVWPPGGLKTYIDTAASMTVSSTNPADGTAGSGAQTVVISSLDGDYSAVEETATLAGLTGVALTNPALRQHRVKVRTAGGKGQNLGNIFVGTGTVTSGNPAVIHAMIAPDNNQSLQAAWTVPAGYDAIVVGVYLTAAAGKTITAGLYARPPGEVFQIKYCVNIYESVFSHHFQAPLHYAEKTDLELRAKVDSTTGAVTGGFEIVLIKHGTSDNWE